MFESLSLYFTSCSFFFVCFNYFSLSRSAFSCEVKNLFPVKYFCSRGNRKGKSLTQPIRFQLLSLFDTFDVLPKLFRTQSRLRDPNDLKD